MRARATFTLLVVSLLVTTSGWAQPELQTWTTPAGSPLGANLFAQERAASASPTLQALVERHGVISVETASLPELLALQEDPEVSRVELAASLQASADEAMASLGLGSSRPDVFLTGRGVVLGIVDSGVDFTHPAFVTDSGQSRIAYLLDFSLPQRDDVHPSIDAHGAALWDRSELEAALRGELEVAHLDVNGHGTHLASIAAGGPGSTPSGGSGMAPEAELIVVRATRGGRLAFKEGDVLEGLRFIKERADALGLPWVANLSAGTFHGPGDGNSLLELGLEALTADGGIVVVAAGNTGARDCRARAIVHPEEPVTVGLLLPLALSIADGDQNVSIDVWYDGEVEVGLRLPNGGSLPAVPAGGGARLDGEGQIWTIANRPPGADGPRGHAVVLLGELGGALSSGSYGLELRGEGEVDLYLNDAVTGVGLFTDHLELDRRLVDPATARGVLVVGSYNSRDRWQAPSGPVELPLRIGEVSRYSAPGPTQDGRPLPDVVAPGDAVLAALSKAADPAQSAFSVFSSQGGVDSVEVGRLHAALRGTSVAAPFVTGAVALLLEGHPELTVEEVRGLLRLSARRDEATGPALYRPRWGFGKLDPVRLLALSDGAEGGAVSLSQSSAGVLDDRIGPGDWFTLWLVLRDDAGRAVALEPALEVRLGGESLQLGAGSHPSPGVWSKTVRGPQTAQRSSLEVRVNGQALLARPALMVEDDELTQSYCGCQTLKVHQSDKVLWCWVGGFAIAFGITTGRRRKRRVRYCG